ncbi:MAG: hypothetical protein IJN74_05475 [Clostridia bacterium]|nr:hypothetical protein [Clostridia bacterium]
MKKKFLAILLGVLLIMSVLPMGIMADKTVTVTPSSNGGNHFLKMEKTLKDGKEAMLTFPFVPEVGVEYKASFDYRIEKGSAAGFFFGFAKGASYESTYISGSSTSVSGNTTGWVTRELTFTGRELTATEQGTSPLFKFGISKSGGTGIVYVDNVKLYKVSDEINLLPNPDFESPFEEITVRVGSSTYDDHFVVPSASYDYYKGGSTNKANLVCSQATSDSAVIPAVSALFYYDFQSASTDVSVFKYKSTHNVERVEFPAESGNYVLKSSGTSTDTVKFIPSFSPRLGVNKLLKLSFKMYVPSEGNESFTEGKSFRIRITKEGSIFSGQSIASPSYNTWTEYELYFNCVDSGNLAAYMEYINCIYYVDDLKLEVFNEESYISGMHVDASATNLRNYAGYLITKGTTPSSYTNTSVVKPVVVFDPDEVGGSAYIFATLSKVEEGVSTLVDIKAKSSTVGDLINVKSSWTLPSVGIFYTDDLAFDLSTYTNLEAGNYEVVYYVWNTNLNALSSRTFNFTVAE